MEGLLQEASKLQKILDRAGIRSAIIGGVAIAVWGEPRLTRDVDLKVLLGRDRAQDLVKLLGKKYVFLAKDPVETLKKMGFIFMKATPSVRLDLLLAETSFDESALRRARSIQIKRGVKLTFCTAEDLIIYKMISTRPRDREDVQGIILRQKNRLDDKYVVGWLNQFEGALDDSTLIRDYRTLKSSALKTLP